MDKLLRKKERIKVIVKKLKQLLSKTRKPKRPKSNLSLSNQTNQNPSPKFKNELHK